MKLEQFKCEVCPYKQQWIPCSERFPEEQDEYFVTWNCPSVSNRIYVGIFEFSEEEGFIPDIGLSNRYKIDVIAWMPLPEPYKEGDQDG